MGENRGKAIQMVEKRQQERKPDINKYSTKRSNMRINKTCWRSHRGEKRENIKRKVMRTS